MSANAKAMLRLSPLLVIYLALIVINPRSDFFGDEGGYVRHAINLTHGYYTPTTDIDLWWGPGYPIILAPFALLKAPWTIAKLLNAFFLFFAVYYFHQTLRLYTNSKYVLHLSYLFGLYLPFLRFISYLLTETFVAFLISALTYHFCKLSQSRTRGTRHEIVAGVCLGYLALTKVLFGYVIVTCLAVAGLVFVFLKRDYVLKKAIVVCCVAFAVCLPYLLYTYSLTSKVFYWGNSGGMQLYWMATPYSDELGDWQFIEQIRANPKLAENHLAFYEKVAKLPSIERDDAFRREAIHNIVTHPLKYFTNWLNNIGRLLFDYPYTYVDQRLRTYYYMIPNMFIVVLGILSIYPAWRRRKVTPKEILALLVFVIIATAGTSLVSAQARQFWVLTPIVDLFIITVLLNSVVVNVPSTDLERVPQSHQPIELAARDAVGIPRQAR